jgi:hypothetical protein
MLALVNYGMSLFCASKVNIVVLNPSLAGALILMDILQKDKNGGWRWTGVEYTTRVKYSTRYCKVRSHFTEKCSKSSLIFESLLLKKVLFFISSTKNQNVKKQSKVE